MIHRGATARLGRERGAVSNRQVVVRRGRHIGWWAEGRWSSGRLFMLTWWPTEGLARAVARLAGGRSGGRSRR